MSIDSITPSVMVKEPIVTAGKFSDLSTRNKSKLIWETFCSSVAETLSYAMKGYLAGLTFTCGVLMSAWAFRNVIRDIFLHIKR